MWTYKQLEAVYWIARLGGFAAAADKLHTTQSAISRRIRELEDQLDIVLFDRRARRAALTEKGQELASLAGRLLSQRDMAVEQFIRPEALQRTLRLGVTELIAMTWLPRLMNLVQQHYPKVALEPEVESSQGLREALLRNAMDLIVVPDAFHDARLFGTRVGQVQNVWISKFGLVPVERALRVHELSRYRLIVQGRLSGAGLFYTRWLQAQGLEVDNALQTSNLLAVLGLTASGMGISYVPHPCFAELMSQHGLQVLEVTPALPPTPYAAFHRAEDRGVLFTGITMLAQACCDFSCLFQQAGPWGAAASPAPAS